MNKVQKLNQANTSLSSKLNKNQTLKYSNKNYFDQIKKLYNKNNAEDAPTSEFDCNTLDEDINTKRSNVSGKANADFKNSPPSNLYVDVDEDSSSRVEPRTLTKHSLKTFDTPQQFSTTKYYQLVSSVPSKFDSKYKFVNLENSDISGSLSRTGSVNRTNLNISSNRIPDLEEINRGIDAYKFRQSLKRCSSKRLNTMRKSQNNFNLSLNNDDDGPPLKKASTSIKCLTRAPSIQKFGLNRTSKSPIRNFKKTDPNILRNCNSINKSLREIRKSCNDIKRNLSPNAFPFQCQSSVKNIKLKQDLQRKGKLCKFATDREKFVPNMLNYSQSMHDIDAVNFNEKDLNMESTMMIHQKGTTSHKDLSPFKKTRRSRKERVEVK